MAKQIKFSEAAIKLLNLAEKLSNGDSELAHAMLRHAADALVDNPAYPSQDVWRHEGL